MIRFIICLMLVTFKSLAMAGSHPNLEYKEIVRTYTTLSSMDLTECKKSFRFLNGNWMDCTISLPRPGVGSPIRQIYPANYPIQSFHLKTAISGLEYYIDIRTTTSSVDEASLGTRLLITGYYMKPGVSEVQRAPKENYSIDRFTAYLIEALERIASQRTLSSRMIVAGESCRENPYIEDQVIGSVYLGKQAQNLELNDCRATYRNEPQDRWPDEDEWASGCSVSMGPARAALPLRQYWSNHLRSIASDSILDIDFPSPEQGDSVLVRISYWPGSYMVALGSKGRDGSTNFNINIPYGDAEKYLVAAFNKVRQVESHFMLVESDLPTLRGSESILGKLALNRLIGSQDVLDIEEGAYGK